MSNLSGSSPEVELQDRQTVLMSRVLTNSWRKQQEGMVLLISLVIILLVTVLSVTALRSTIASVSSTATLQQQAIIYQELNAELTAQMDFLMDMQANKSTNASFYRLLEYLDNSSYNVGGGIARLNQITLTDDPDRVFDVRIVLSDLTTNRGWSDSDADRAAAGIVGYGIPVIERNICPENEGQFECANYIVVATWRNATGSLYLQQMLGFWQPAGVISE